MSERFAFIREPEGEALKRLSPLAAKVFIAVRLGRREDQPFELGVRDFKDWLISKDQAARGLAELVAAGLLETLREASFGEKRVRRRFRIVHRKQAGQSQNRDAATGGSRKGATVIPIQSRRRDYQKPLQSQNRDIHKEASSPSAQKPKGEEAAGRRPEPPPPDGGGSAARVCFREERRCVERAASRLAMSAYALTAALGGPKAAASLALALHRGDLSLVEARARLTSREECFGKGAGGEGDLQPHASALAARGTPIIFTVKAA